MKYSKSEDLLVPNPWKINGFPLPFLNGSTDLHKNSRGDAFEVFEDNFTSMWNLYLASKLKNSGRKCRFLEHLKDNLSKIRCTCHWTSWIAQDSPKGENINHFNNLSKINQIYKLQNVEKFTNILRNIEKSLPLVPLSMHLSLEQSRISWIVHWWFEWMNIS